MRGCVSSRQRFQSNCLANAALHGERVASLSLSLSVFLSFSLARSLAHSRSRAPGSRPGRDRFERSRRPSSARPRPDTASASHSLSPDSRSLFLERAAPVARPIPSRSLSLASSNHPRTYTHTFPLPHNVVPYSLAFGLLRFSAVSIERAFRDSPRPSPAAQTQHEGERRPRVSTMRLST